MPDASRTPAPPDPVRGVFLGDLAHDLSTPLTAIHGAIELLLAGAYGPLDGEQRALVHDVLASARELKSIVQDVADLGALDGGRLQFGVARVNLAALIDELRSMIGDAAAKRGVGFAIDAPDAGTPIASDERRLRQILTCVLGYAMKASRRGSQITALVDVQGEQLRLEVRTSGINVGEPHLLFADRRDPTPGVPKPYRGPGLGLPLVARVVQAWGGSADATMSDGTLVLRVEVPVHAV